MTPEGKLQHLTYFKGPNGQGPDAALIQAMDGSFYGTAGGGGANSDGVVFRFVP